MNKFVCALLTLMMLAVSVVDVSAAGADQGIDLYVLVDTSRSMVTTGMLDIKENGNDRLRIRWDAVKLLIDVLGPEDRVLIRRFSGPVDAASKFSKGEIAVALPPSFKDFPTQLEYCSATNREKIVSVIKQLNIPAVPAAPGSTKLDELDRGGTDIFGALKNIEAETRKPSKGNRHPQIILLTDGSDANIMKYLEPLPEADSSPDKMAQQPISVAELRKALPSLLDPTNPIPIHTVGLNLDALKNYRIDGSNSDPGPDLSEAEMKAGKSFFIPFERDKSIQLLKLLSLHSNGTMRPAKKASDLLPLYLDLIRDVKELWSSEKTVEPTEPRIVKTSVVHGVLDFRVLTYVDNTEDGKPEQKDSIKPPAGLPEKKYRWAAGSKLTAIPAPRQGTFSGQGMHAPALLYDLLYFGPPSSLPFSTVVDPVDFEVDLHAESKPTRVYWFKSVEPFFTFLLPKSVHRHERLPVSFKMLKEDFPATGFRFELHPSIDQPLVSKTAESPSTPVPAYQLERSTSDPTEVSVNFTPGADKLLTWTHELEKQTLNLTLSAEGTKDAQGREHSLTGFIRRFIPLRLSILNKLPLEATDQAQKKVESITLSRDPEPQTFNLVIPFEVEPDAEIPVDVTFIPPQPRKAQALPKTSPNPGALPASVFDLEVNGQPLRLKAAGSNGVETIRLSSSRTKISLAMKGEIPAKVSYTPGSLTFKAADSTLNEANELSIPVELHNDELKIDIIDAKLNRPATALSLNIGQQVTTDPFLIQLRDAEKNAAGLKDLNLQVDVLSHPKSLAGQEVQLEPQDFEIRSADDPGKPNPDWRKTGWSLQKKFVLFIKTTRDFDSKTPARLKLVANGPGFGNSEMKVDLHFKNPEYTLSNVDRRFDCSLGQELKLAVGYQKTSTEVFNDQRKIGLDREFHSGPIKFTLVKGPTVSAGEVSQFTVTLDNEQKTWLLEAETPAGTEFYLPITVPGNLAPGQYQTELHFNGPQIVVKEPVVILSIFVDRLVPKFRDETAPMNLWMTVKPKESGSPNAAPTYQVTTKTWLFYPPQQYRLHLHSILEAKEITVEDFEINSSGPNESAKIYLSSAGQSLPNPVSIQADPAAKSWLITITPPQAANQTWPYIGKLILKDVKNHRQVELELQVPCIDPRKVLK